MILVTGASGFLGQHLVRLLSAQGEKVRALYHSHAPASALTSLPGIQWHKADLLDVYDVAEAVTGITKIYHCAAMVSFLPQMQEQMLHFNPESTTNIVNEALEQNIEKLVYVSSVAAIGRSELETKAITEEEQWGESKYNSAYGLSKYLAETEVWRGIGEGLNAVIVNPGIILGEGDWNKGSAELMKIAYKEFPFYTNGVTGWVDVKDVAAILQQLMESTTTGERYIISSGNYTYREIFTQMAKALGKKPPKFEASSLMTGIVWRLGRISQLLGKKPVITKETASNARSKSIYNNEKLLKALPEFKYTPIEETINRMATVFLSSIP